MIKIQNNTPVRESLPAFLAGLAPESLADLAWTDPALGVSDCRWLPEVDVSGPLGPLQRYGDETLTLAGDHVEVRREVLDFTQAEIDADRKGRTPAAVTMAQARLALLSAGMLGKVAAALASLPSPQKDAAQIEWEYRPMVQRSSIWVAALAPALGMTDAQLDELFIQAATL